jgi:hypothetical protein
MQADDLAIQDTISRDGALQFGLERMKASNRLYNAPGREYSTTCSMRRHPLNHPLEPSSRNAAVPELRALDASSHAHAFEKPKEAPSRSRLSSDDVPRKSFRADFQKVSFKPNCT